MGDRSSVSEERGLPDGKDEMNLAEFPLCAISDRLPPGETTLVFKDRTWDASRGEMVPRCLTITGSSEYGLPTAQDDEVLLGLIQISKMRGFAERKVPFSRYQLIRLLNWREESRSYDRIENSLNRWVGVTLYYENAWRNKRDQCWADEKFHILDNVTLFDRDRLPPGTTQPPVSSFTWNETIFQSFEAGNLKKLDFDYYLGLKSAIAKRVYRFLDKRFYQRPRWEFNLREFAFEHIGMARSYDSANLKRKLKCGLAELEEKGFLVPLPDEERFRKVRSGDWNVLFQRVLPPTRQPSVSGGTEAKQLNPLQTALEERGVTSSVALELVTGQPAERIATQLEVFDWLASQNEARLARNPAGFLVASIRSEYAPPKAFLDRAALAEKAASALQRKTKAEEKARREEEARRRKELAKADAIAQFWSTQSDDERLRLEEEALAAATSLERGLLERGGSGAAASRRLLLDAFALRMMQDAQG